MVMNNALLSLLSRGRTPAAAPAAAPAAPTDYGQFGRDTYSWWQGGKPMTMNGYTYTPNASGINVAGPGGYSYDYGMGSIPAGQDPYEFLGREIMSNPNMMMGAQPAAPAQPGGFQLPQNFFGLAPGSSSSSSSSSSGFSGIDYGSPIWGGIGQKMIDLAGQLPETIDKYTNNATDLYQSMMRQATGKGNSFMQGQLNELNKRGILDSTIAGDVISKNQLPMLQQIAQNAYQGAMGGAKMQMGVPAMLGDLTNLARISQSSGGSSGGSQNVDPLAPYNSYMNWVLRGAGM